MARLNFDARSVPPYQDDDEAPTADAANDPSAPPPEPMPASPFFGDGPDFSFKPEHLSDDDMASRFVDQHGAQFRWTPGMDWMVHAGTHWVHDADLLRFDLARKVCRQAAAGATKPDVARKVSSAATVAATLRLAQSDRRVALPADQWDADPFALNTPGGVYDLRTGSLRPHHADDYMTQVTSVAPATVQAPVFNKFIHDVFAGDAEMVAFVQRLLGYCLTGDRREQVLPFWHGSGANGKSTLLDLVRKLLGSYATALPAEELMTSRNERHKTGIASLRGKRLALSSELEEGQHWNEPLVKALTGDETMSARFMRQDFFEFKQTHKHIIVGNSKPRLRGGDPAMARRLLLVPFVVKFEGAARDYDMPQKLHAEGPAVLAWMVRGAVAWHAGGLGVPAAVRGAVAEYMADHDDLALWIEECCTRDGHGRASALYWSYAEWKKARGEQPCSQTVWGSRMGAIPGVVKFKSSGMHYRGVSLRAAFGASATHQA